MLIGAVHSSCPQAVPGQWVVHSGKLGDLGRRQSVVMADDRCAQDFTRKQIRAQGLSNRQIDARLASGALVTERRGILRPARQSVLTPDPSSPSSTPGPAAPAADLPIPIEVRAGLLACPGRDLVVSHATAARLFGLPRPLAGWPQPQFTATSGSTQHRNGIQIKVAALDATQVVLHQGIALTSPARTVADCLRTLPGRDGLALLDAALNRGLISTDEVLERLRRQARWPGVTLARRVLALADPLRESPLESWSGWAFAHTGVPAPQWQVEIRETGGGWIGRADCWWRGGVIGEADGRSKYALAAAERGGDADAVFRVLQAERRREQRMRDVGAEVVRWSTADVLNQPAAQRLAERITNAITVAHSNPRFTGIALPTSRP
jgi:hypothetical protein